MNHIAMLSLTAGAATATEIITTDMTMTGPRKGQKTEAETTKSRRSEARSGQLPSRSEELRRRKGMGGKGNSGSRFCPETKKRDGALIREGKSRAC